MEGHKLHLGTVDALLGQALPHGKDYFRLVLLLITNRNAVLVTLRAGGAKGVQQF